MAEALIINPNTPPTSDKFRGGIFDTESQERQAWGDEREKERATQVALYVGQLHQERHVILNKLNDLDHQSGRRLVAQMFESKVKKLCKKVIFITKPLTDSQCDFVGLAHGSSMKSMDLLLPDGSHYPIAGFQNHPIMPEYTILLHREVIVPNFTVHHADASEFPEAGLVTKADGTREWKFDGPTPLETKTLEPAGTIVGWRTILARLVLEGLATPQEVEKEFGISDRKAWAVRMGKRNEQLGL